MFFVSLCLIVASTKVHALQGSLLSYSVSLQSIVACTYTKISPVFSRLQALRPFTFGLDAMISRY